MDVLWGRQAEFQRAEEHVKRIEQLEEELVVERCRCDQKEKECTMSRDLILKLESTLEQQQCENERLLTLENTIAQQRPAAYDEKVEKLLLAVAGERQRVEECTTQMQVLREQLRSEQERRVVSDQKVADRDAKIDAMQKQQDALVNRLAEKERQCGDTQRQLDEARLQLAALSVRPGLPAIPEGADAHAVDVSSCQDLHNDAAECIKAGEQPARSLQEQLASSISELHTLMGHLDVKESLLANQQLDLCQAIQRQREVCDLQQQLADEIAKRRDVEKHSLDQGRLIAERDQKLAKKEQQLAQVKDTVVAAQRRSDQSGHFDKDSPISVFRPTVISGPHAFAKEALDVPAGPPLEPPVVAGHRSPMALSPFRSATPSASRITVALAPVLSAANTPKESRSGAPVRCGLGRPVLAYSLSSPAMIRGAQELQRQVSQA